MPEAKKLTTNIKSGKKYFFCYQLEIFHIFINLNIVFLPLTITQSTILCLAKKKYDALNNLSHSALAKLIHFINRHHE